MAGTQLGGGPPTFIMAPWAPILYCFWCQMKAPLSLVRLGWVRVRKQTFLARKILHRRRRASCSASCWQLWTMGGGLPGVRLRVGPRSCRRVPWQSRERRCVAGRQSASMQSLPVHMWMAGVGEGPLGKAPWSCQERSQGCLGPGGSPTSILQSPASPLCSYSEMLAFTLTAFLELMDHGIVSWDVVSTIFIKQVWPTGRGRPAGEGRC